MHILAIETTGPYGSCSIIDDNGNILAYSETKDQMSHLKNLIPMIDEALKQANLTKSQIDYVASSVGAGSFTGIRIGVTTARAIAQALNIQAIKVPTLNAFTYKTEIENLKTAEQGKVPVAILNARRGQVYAMIDGYMEPCACMLDDVLEICRNEILSKGGKVIFLGDGVDAYESTIIDSFGGEFEGSLEFSDRAYRYQDAKSVAKYGLEMVRQNKNIVSYAELFPEYMRKPEAEQKLERGELPICKGVKQE